jgi:hypothetical protein
MNSLPDQKNQQGLRNTSTIDRSINQSINFFLSKGFNLASINQSINQSSDQAQECIS